MSTFILNEETIKLFKEKYVEGPVDACWEWTAYRMSNGKGHGQLRQKGITYYAHRIAYLIAYGDYHEGWNVCHRCDNPPCVNPKHLFLASHSDNMKDKMEKKRQPVGEAADSWLFDKEVDEIKQMYATGKYTQQYLSKKFGVCQTQISRIVNGLRWRHKNVEIGTLPAIEKVASNNTQEHE